MIGTVGGTTTVAVDGRGRLTTEAGARVDWLVGAADRWHEPAREGGTAVTQRREGGLPVVETHLRVPGGQLVHRAWGVAKGGGVVGLVEIENRSRDAVAVAVVVEAPARGVVRFDGERTVEVDGRPVLISTRPVARVTVGHPGDVRATVTAAIAPQPTGPAEGPAVALVLPLAHTARLRLALPAGDANLRTNNAVDTLPGAEEVAAGWRTHVLAGARISLPDAALADAVTAARVRLLLGDAADGPRDEAAAAVALLRWGHLDAGAIAVGRLGDGGRRPEPDDVPAILAAWAAQARVAGPAFAEPLAEPAARLAHKLGRGRRRGGPASAAYATAQHDAADLLDVAGQPDAAELCRERAGTTHPAAVAAPGQVPAASVADVAAGSRPAAAALLLAVARLLVDDHEPGSLRVLDRFPDEWLGQDLEVHRLATRAGELSYALRWHGPRPAILWERVPREGSTERVALAVPHLDPRWSSVHHAGEALLEPVLPPGGLPKVVAPLAPDRTPVDEHPGDGVSFT